MQPTLRLAMDLSGIRAHCGDDFRACSRGNSRSMATLKIPSFPATSERIGIRVAVGGECDSPRKAGMNAVSSTPSAAATALTKGRIGLRLPLTMLEMLSAPIRPGIPVDGSIGIWSCAARIRSAWFQSRASINARKLLPISASAAVYLGSEWENLDISHASFFSGKIAANCAQIIQMSIRIVVTHIGRIKRTGMTRRAAHCSCLHCACPV